MKPTLVRVPGAATAARSPQSFIPLTSSFSDVRFALDQPSLHRSHYPARPDHMPILPARSFTTLLSDKGHSLATTIIRSPYMTAPALRQSVLVGRILRQNGTHSTPGKELWMLKPTRLLRRRYLSHRHLLLAPGVFSAYPRVAMLAGVSMLPILRFFSLNLCY